ncbi:PTS beta-glucoside transporter subunit IIABC [Actinomyces viscosus]|uniref:EIIBCA-Bgl n=1 Tax=Actinomyces viscosus TaxID=1656 RepID=A0A448PK84_ACTVI|nr:PTS glucose transporter subunit IIABC [Actinomyces viscosus]TFH54198.1 PTS beta-glucoside transporter subunit IIABC [Actinomyces viscosus]VEI15500.1 EIIBCA-Bgl [Actinomyces viscosus]
MSQPDQGPEVPISAPVTGMVIDLADVPDPVFSSKAVGDGLGVEPDDGAIVSPVDATVTMVAGTGHAIGFKSESGLEVLLHLGVDTVELEGAPFDLSVKVGDTVKAGDSLGTMDLEAVRAAGKATTAIVVLTNTITHLADLTVTTGHADAGAAIATATLKGEDDSQAGSAGTSAAVEASGSGADGERTDGLTGFDATAADIITGIGGPDNVRSVLHCITRVRFYLKDESLADDEAVADLDGVIDVVKSGGQYQVVIGPDVVDVYDAVVAQLPNVGGGEQAADVEVVERPTTLWGWVKLGFSSLIGVITGSMIPVVGMLAASGILKGILALLMQYKIVTEASNTYHFIDAMSSSMFYFLPIIVGFTAAKRLGADPIVVAIIGGVLCYPSVVEMSKNTSDVITVGRTVFNADFFGIPVSLPANNAYAYSIFPIIVGAWLASKIEPWLKKALPAVIRPIFGPLIEIFVVSALILLVFGPAVMLVSGGIASVINAVLDINYTLAGLLIGGFYQCLVIFGLHWAVIPIISSELASPGYSHLNAIVSATMIAQGGGALAVWLKVRDARIKRMAAPATISAFCGVTEPAMYGLNLKYGRIFITASVGGAVGGLLTGLLNVNMWGFTGAFVGFPSFVNPEGVDSSFTGFWIAGVAALVVSFLCTYFFGFKQADFEKERTVKKVRLGNREPVAK